MTTDQVTHIFATFTGGVIACLALHFAKVIGYPVSPDTEGELATAFTFIIAHGWPYFIVWARQYFKKPKVAP